MKKKKIALVIIVAILGVFLVTGVVQALGEENPAQNQQSNGQTDSQLVQEQMADIDLNKMESFINEINRQTEGVMPKLDLKSLITNGATGKMDLSLTTALSGMLKYLFKEVVADFKLLMQLLVLALACAVLDNLQGAFEESTTGKIAHAVIYLVLITIAISSFILALNTGKDAINNMVDFMYALVPILITLLAALGNVTSATIFHPLSFAVVGVASTVIKNIIFPLIFLSVVVGLVGNVTDKFKVNKLAGFIRSIGIFLMGLLFTVFVGFLGIQGIGGSVADGVAMRTVKYATGAFIPVVGKMFSDALDAVVGTSLILKNAIGVVGIIIIFLLALFPALKLLAIMLIYRFTAAVAQPVVDDKIVRCLEQMASGISLVFATVAAVSLTFFFVITVIVGAGNISVMMR